MSSISSDYESSYYTESEAESDYVTHEEGQQTHYNHTREVEDIIREHVNVTTKNAVGLNHHYRAKLLVLRAQLEGLLSRCRNRLAEVDKSLDDLRFNLTPKPRPIRSRYPGYICGQPFFKDHELYPGPHNEDYLYRKSAKREFFPLDLFETTETLWTRKDKQMLKSSIETQALEFLQREYALREKRCNNSESAERIRNERKELDTLPIEEIWSKALAYDGKYGRQKFTVDWLKLSTIVMGGRHSVAACEGMWNNYLMPGLKRSNWTQEEESELIKAAEAHKCHRWDMIAQCVSERSEYQCFVHYQTNFSELVQSKKRPWTKDEDALLIRTVEENRIGNHVIWNKVVERMPYRNKVQVYHRYRYTLQRPLRRTKFTEEEDCVITAYVLQYGNDFKFFPDELLPGRTTKQIWARYMNTLRFVNQHVGWNLEEDKRLMSYIAEHLTEEGPQTISWAHCSKTLGNHSRLSCRARYYTIERFLEKNPEATLEDVPRRDKKKLSTNVTDKNWVQTIVDIKSAPKGATQKVGGGPINLFQTGKPSTAEWSLYEQMKFCFRYKYGNGLTGDALPPSRVFTGTKMFLHLLEGFQHGEGSKALLPSPYPLRAKDKPLLEAVLHAPLDWPNVVSIMRPKISVSGEAMLFCRIPPNYNTVLGLRGVCLNACSEPVKQLLPELKMKKLDKFNEPSYNEAMTLFIERFRKIFHWTMLLMMLNIDDVTLENDESIGNDIIASTSNKPEIQLKPIENLICPVKMDKLMNVSSCGGSYTERAIPCNSFTPIMNGDNESNLKLVTNITIIDPKDLPAVPACEYGGDNFSNQYIQTSSQPFEPSKNCVRTLKEDCNPNAKQEPRRTKSSRPRKSTKREAPHVDEQNVVIIPQRELEPEVDFNQHTLIDKYKQGLENSLLPSETGSEPPTVSNRTTNHKGRNDLPKTSERITKCTTRSRAKTSKSRKNTEKAAPRGDRLYHTERVASTEDLASTDPNLCETQKVTTFTIMEVPQDMYSKEHQQQDLNFTVDTHVSYPPESLVQSNGCFDGVNTNDIYSGQLVQSTSTFSSNVLEDIQQITAEQRNVEFHHPTDTATQSESITNMHEVLPGPLGNINNDGSYSKRTEDPSHRSVSMCGDIVVADKSHIISNTPNSSQETEHLIVTEREIQMPSGQIAFEGNYIAYCINEDQNPDPVAQEMLVIHSVSEPSHNLSTIASDSVCWHQTVEGLEDSATLGKKSDELYAQELPNESIATLKTETKTDSKTYLNLELLGNMEGEQVTAVDIIRMLSKRRDSEDSDEETEVEDVTND